MLYERRQGDDGTSKTIKRRLKCPRTIANICPRYAAPYLSTSLASDVGLAVNYFPGNVKKKITKHFQQENPAIIVMQGCRNSAG